MINAAAARPLRLHAVEAAVVGKPRNEQTAELAGQIAIEGAQALRYNGYKIPLMRNLVKRAIRAGVTRMDFVKWGLNPWGQNILTHVSWTLFWASLFAGVMFLVAHGSYMLLSAHRKRPADRDRQAGSGPREPPRRASSGTR